MLPNLYILRFNFLSVPYNKLLFKNVTIFKSHVKVHSGAVNLNRTSSQMENTLFKYFIHIFV